MSYIKDPKAIEESSFQIITAELEALVSEVTFESPLHEAIVKRAIHTSADFEYYETLKFTHDVLSRLVEALRGGCTLYTDTTMALSGINKTLLNAIGCKVVCLIADEKVRVEAIKKGITRSMAAVDSAFTRPGLKVFVIGNAPTALYRIMENYQQNPNELVAVIGVPVGFVGASESKDVLYQSEIPSIVSLGRKGGSNVAAAIVNAVLYGYQNQ